MSITKRSFGTLPDGRKVTAYRLENSSGASAEFLDYGCIIRALCVPGRSGALADVVVGFDDIVGYLATDDAYYGAVVGRVGNRIKNGRFTLNGKIYQLAKNNGENHLHGGLKGFSRSMWDCIEGYSDGNLDSVTFRLLSPDGDDGYPGNLKITVKYTFTGKNVLRLDYHAETDADTILNVTNHAYFNLAGHDNGNIRDHMVEVFADKYNAADDSCMVTGELLPVEGTPLDLREARPMGPAMDAVGGIDHNFVFGNQFGTAVPAARVWDPASGRVMTVTTDQVGMQLYTGNFMEDKAPGKGGCHYGKQGAFCMETQHIPDSVNHPEWPTVILRAGEVFESFTEYAFTAE